MRNSRTWLVATAALLLSCTAETAENEESEAAAPAVDEASDEDTPAVEEDRGSEVTEEEADDEPEPIEVATWTGEDLPRAAGRATVVDDLAVVFAEEDRTLLLLVVDVRTGEEQWRAEIHQHGRIPGTVPRPSVDAERRLVVATDYDDDTRDFDLVAFDLDEGEERWRASTGWVRSTPSLCGDESWCVSLSEGGVNIHDRDDGSLRASSDEALERAIGGSGDLLVTADASEQLLELGEFGDDGYERHWRLSFSDVWGDDGDAVSPDGGWSVRTIDDGDRVAISLGPSVPDGDLEPAELIEASANGGVALLDRGGEVLAASIGVTSCLDLVVDDLVLLCEGIEIATAEEVDERFQNTNDPELPVQTVSGAIAWDAAGGEVVWEAAFSAPIARAGTATSPTNDDRWQIRMIDGETELLDLGNGAIDPVSGEDDLVVRCSDPDPDPELRQYELDTFDGEVGIYLRPDSVSAAAPCDLDGNELAAEELLAVGALPDWYGISTHVGADDEGDEGDDPVEEADSEVRWTLWSTAEGVLQGIGPAES